MPSAPETPQPRKISWPVLIVLLALTAVLAERWQAHKLLNQDEMFVLQTDSVPTLAQVAHIQLHYPISLDPMVYHALAHLATSVFGATPFALRLPSLAGYLLMQLCLFFFVRRAVLDATGNAARAEFTGHFAMLFPVLTATLFYAAEARPYGLLLGFYALAVLSWQTATRSREAQRPRWSLVTLALSIALALNAHYFAILLLPVLYLAELVRALDRRRLDLPVVAALVAGTAAFALALPFQHAMASFRTHYYNAGGPSLRAITQAYRSLFVDYTQTSLRTQHFAALLFLLLALIFVAALALRWRTFLLPRAESVLILLLAALPFFGFLLARFVTHSYEVRYVLGAIIGISILLALLLSPLFATARTARPWAGLLVLLAIAIATLHAHTEARTSAALLHSLEPTPAMRDALAADPSHTLYIQQMGHFELAQYYQPDPDLRAHTVLVYDSAREIALLHHDTEALTAEHMTHFTSLPIARYDDVAHDRQPHLWALYTGGWDFTAQAFAADHALSTPVSPWFEGTSASVRFPQQP